MRNRVTHLCAALVIAAAGTACTGRNGSVGNDRRAQGGGNRGVNERVSLRGCVQPAVTEQGYALRHVIVVPSLEQPQGQETMEHPLIARGSEVRLAAATGMTDDLKSYLNNEVTITGDVVEPGPAVVGTAGHDGAPKETPRIAVETVKKIADNCAGE
jgi:hypothetical protein